MAPQKRVKDELEKGSQFASERSSAEREVNVHRSNIENWRSNIVHTPPSNLDPLRLQPMWRDPFPAVGLLGKGYLGDGYPLCSDLPARGFLRRGAALVSHCGRPGPPDHVDRVAAKYCFYLALRKRSSCFKKQKSKFT